MPSPRPDETPLTVIRPTGGWSGVNLADLWRFRELWFFLVWRDVKVRYQQTALGVLWAILQPVATMVAFTVVLHRLGGLPTDGLPAPVFYLSTLLIWHYVSQGVTAGANSLVNSQHLVSKVHFPRAIIPLAAVTTPLVDLALGAVLLGLTLAWHGIAPSPRLFALPLFLALGFALVLSVSLWLAALNAYYRDVRHTLPFLVQLWLFSSPVAYPLALIPERVWAVYALNPAVAVLEGCRWALTGHGQLSPEVVVPGLVVTGVLLVGGSVVFRRVERTLADVI